MKRKIIVPVDFSATSQNAYLYARELAKVYDARIEVVHIYMGALDIHDPLPIKQGKTISEVLLDQLDKFIELYPQEITTGIATKIRVSTRLLHGSTIREIIRLSKEDTTSMIVMGTLGQSDMVDRLMGSISTVVAQKAYCPVLLVPKGAKYFKYENILYASNYESANHHMLERILTFNKTFNAALHFIHINKGEEKYDPIESTIFDKLFERGAPQFAFNLSFVNARSTLKGLFEYARKHEVDLIVLVNRQRSFLESVFGASMTKKIALRTPTPMLVYHI